MGGPDATRYLWKQPFSAVRASGGYPGNDDSQAVFPRYGKIRRSRDRCILRMMWNGVEMHVFFKTCSFAHLRPLCKSLNKLCHSWSYIQSACWRVSLESQGNAWYCFGSVCCLGPLLLTCFSVIPSMDKQLHPLYGVGWNYLSIPKLQRCSYWILGIDKKFHLTLYWACDYLSMLGLKLNHVSKRGHWSSAVVMVPS